MSTTTCIFVEKYKKYQHLPVEKSTLSGAVKLSIHLHVVEKKHSV